MSTAETLIKEYLDRGFSLEALRLLAETRPHPLGGDMLRIIDAMEETAEPVSCEAGLFTAAESGDSNGEKIFFVANDDENVGGGDGTDFDLMASITPGGGPKLDGEESVADILIGETDGSGVVPLAPAPPLAKVETRSSKSEGSLWHRLWSRMYKDAPPLLEQESETPRTDEKTADEEAHIPSPASPAAEKDGIPDEEAPVATDEAAAREAIPPEAENAEPETVAAVGRDTEIRALEMTENVALHADVALDYIPGAAEEARPGEEARDEHIEEAKRALEEAQSAIVSATEKAEPEASNAAPPAEAESFADADAPAPDAKTSRRERRRRERALKKKGKRSKKADAASSLPEIVLTRSEGTETLMPEDEAAPAVEAAAPETEAVDSGPDAVNEAPGAETESLTASVPETGLEPEKEFKEFEGGSGHRESATLDEERPAAEPPGERCESTDGAVGTAPENPPAETMDSEPPPDAVSPELPNLNEPEEAGPREELPVAEAPEPADAESGADGELEAARETLEPRGEEPYLETAASADGGIQPTPPESFAIGSDHLMIVASGDFEARRIERLLLSDSGFAGADAEGVDDEEEAVDGNNVILFRDKFPVFHGADIDDYLDDDELGFQPVLRVLPPLEEDVAAAGTEDEPEAAAEPAPEPEAAAEPAVEEFAAEAAAMAPPTAAEVLTDDERVCLLRGLGGLFFAEEPFPGQGEEPPASADHVIVTPEPEPVPSAELEREAAVRAEMELEYQSRLDEFAARILQAQAETAAREAGLREKDEEIGKRDAALAALRKTADGEEKRLRSLERRLDDARREVGARQAELERMSGLQDEHRKLFDEFEDLRRAYNEMVMEIMPALQSERDDLALTVERQCEKERALKTTINVSRRRLAASYVLGAAACLMLVALPVANWMKTGSEQRDLALEHQKVSELRENYQAVVAENTQFKNELVELERKVGRARMDLADALKKNDELSRTAQRDSLAVFRPTDSGSAGMPTRTSEMALQAMPLADGRLRTNEVRDPAGSIESLYAHNRSLNEQDDARLAQSVPPASSREPISLNAVARRAEPSAGSSLRPGRNGAPASTVRASPTRPGAPRTGESVAAGRGGASPRQGEVVAKVKRGEGVAQVVYRVLGTWDPEVVSWVIRENNIKSDRRGNPIIQPDQELRLPKEGRIGQAASATRR